MSIRIRPMGIYNPTGVIFAEEVVVDVCDEKGNKYFLCQHFNRNDKTGKAIAHIGTYKSDKKEKTVDLIVSHTASDEWEAKFNITIVDKEKFSWDGMVTSIDMLQATFRTKEDAYEASIRLAYQWSLYDKEKFKK